MVLMTLNHAYLSFIIVFNLMYQINPRYMKCMVNPDERNSQF